jgi:hypothetical protein
LVPKKFQRCSVHVASINYFYRGMHQERMVYFTRQHSKTLTLL